MALEYKRQLGRVVAGSVGDDGRGVTSGWVTSGRADDVFNQGHQDLVEEAP